MIQNFNHTFLLLEESGSYLHFEAAVSKMSLTISWAIFIGLFVWRIWMTKKQIKKGAIGY